MGRDVIGLWTFYLARRLCAPLTGEAAEWFAKVRGDLDRDVIRRSAEEAAAAAVAERKVLLRLTRDATEAVARPRQDLRDGARGRRDRDGPLGLSASPTAPRPWVGCG